MKYLLLIAVTFIVSSASFAQDYSPSPARVPGMLSSEANPIVIPSIIKINRDFDVTVTTGGNGCVAQGDTSVVLSDRSADIFVYDLTTATQPDTMCTMIYKEFKHTATLRFTKKGRASIRFWVRTARSRSPMGVPVLIERRLIVK